MSVVYSIAAARARREALARQRLLRDLPRVYLRELRRMVAVLGVFSDRQGATL